MSLKAYTMQWDFVCRVCLREGEMYSIFNENDNNKKEISIYDKIVKCVNITLKRGMNLPEKICKTCLNDLDAAYRFHINCEKSNAILKSFTRGNMTDLIISKNGEMYKYKPPAGLNVKRIKKTITETVTAINTDENIQQTYEIQLETLDNKDEIELVDNEDNNLLIDDEFITEDYLEEEHINDNANPIKSEEQIIEYDEEIDDSKDFKKIESNTIYTIKPVKSNKESAKTRGKKKASSTSSTRTKKDKIKILPTKDITLKPDSSAIIRLRKCEEEKPLKICEICGNTYKYKHALESHMRRHRNEKPFACEICGRAFVINFELRRHMRTHTGQKPYACRYCGRKFSDFGSRIKHERTHTGERPYACETCGKAFSYSHVLQSHILTHTGERRYECLVCGRRFTKSHHLKAHTKIHNKNQNNSVVKQPIETVRSAVTASTSTSSLVATSTWATTDNTILNSVLLNNEQKMIIETTEDEQVYFHTGDDNVFVIKQENMEKDENLDLNQR